MENILNNSYTTAYKKNLEALEKEFEKQFVLAYAFAKPDGFKKIYVDTQTKAIWIQDCMNGPMSNRLFANWKPNENYVWNDVHYFVDDFEGKAEKTLVDIVWQRPSFQTYNTIRCYLTMGSKGEFCKWEKESDEFTFVSRCAKTHGIKNIAQEDWENISKHSQIFI
jgi:hypothetical protein